MLLVKRDSRNTKEIAIAMNIDKSYLPRLYKMDILPSKPLKKAQEVFGVSAEYFLGDSAEPMAVSEPDVPYVSISTFLLMQAENASLRDELRLLTTMLEQQRSINADLAEALKNLSKRD